MTTDFLYTRPQWRFIGKMLCRIGLHYQVVMGFYVPAEFYSCACGAISHVTHEHTLRDM